MPLGRRVYSSWLDAKKWSWSTSCEGTLDVSAGPNRAGDITVKKQACRS
jgi:hypothetical protein